MHRILVAHSDASMRILFSEELFEEGYDVTSCGNLNQLSELLETKSTDLLIMNAALVGCTGLDRFASILQRSNAPPLLLCVNHSGMRENPLMAVDHYKYDSLSLEGLKNKVKRILAIKKTHQTGKKTDTATRQV